MFCKHCGNQINDQAYICIHCGSQVGNAQVTAKKSNGYALGVVGLCFSFLIPIVTFICSGIGLSHASSSNHQGSKALNIVALSLGVVIFIANILTNLLGSNSSILY